MNTYEKILEIYETMAVKSAQMVLAAQDSDWDWLMELEHECSALVATLRCVDSGTPRPDAAYVQRKAALIRKILAGDA